MSSSTASQVRSVLNAVDSCPESPEIKGPWLPDQAELGSKSAPWDPWKCEMHWRDNMYTLTPRTPDRSLNLASFLDSMHVIAIAEASSPKKNGPGRVPPLDYTEDSLVASSSGVVATRYICNMAPDRDIDLLRRADDSEAVSNGVGGEVVRRLTRAHRAVTTTRRSFDEAMSQHAELLARLDELEALRARDQQAVEAQEEALEDQLAAEKAAREATKSELDAALAKKTAVEAELEETKALAEEEVGRLKSDVIHAWDRSKEEFLQSSEFNTLCTKRSLCYFKDGFAGCLAQFRANGYSEEEHPASFLDAKKALMELPDEEAEEEEEEEEGEVSGDEGTLSSSPK
ncbi:hypothetical protein F511_18452 [Dorcoceras hygrometricum]|uniref:Uncharacterized protein n=1 Tax=Dorcoceras hygrometricum TaxID=472368 RepID=A0A2Z7A763_9LAMI|nr:hypothetical protein F511_18452 [Dorcoceras hygrometricum]